MKYLKKYLSYSNLFKYVVHMSEKAKGRNDSIFGAIRITLDLLDNEM